MLCNCVRENIPLIGHRNNANPEVGKSDLTNSGNLVELLKFR